MEVADEGRSEVYAKAVGECMARVISQRRLWAVLNLPEFVTLTGDGYCYFLVKSNINAPILRHEGLGNDEQVEMGSLKVPLELLKMTATTTVLWLLWIVSRGKSFANGIALTLLPGKICSMYMDRLVYRIGAYISLSAAWPHLREQVSTTILTEGCLLIGKEFYLE